MSYVEFISKMFQSISNNIFKKLSKVKLKYKKQHKINIYNKQKKVMQKKEN